MKQASENKTLIDLLQLEQQIVSLLQGKFSDAKTVPPTNLRATIHEQITHAYRYGLETEQQFSDYVITFWQFGREFDLEFPGVKEMLGSSELSATEKSEWLTQWADNMIFASQGNK